MSEWIELSFTGTDSDTVLLKSCMCEFSTPTYVADDAQHLLHCPDHSDKDMQKFSSVQWLCNLFSDLNPRRSCTMVDPFSDRACKRKKDD